MTPAWPRRCVALLVLAVLLATACAGSSEPPPDVADAAADDAADAVSIAAAGTPYLQLDLGTPEAGAFAFIDAWNRRDFIQAQQLMDVPAQRNAVAAANSVLYGEWVVRPYIAANLSDEHVIPEFLFAQSLWGAAEWGALRVDLTGASVVGVGETGQRNGRPSAVVAIEFADGSPGELAMVESVSGRWRVALIGSPTVAGAVDRQVVVTDSCTFDRRVELFDGVDCAVLEEPRLETEVSNRVLCAIMQGVDISFVGPSLPPDSLQRAEELAVATCPGDPQLVTSFTRSYREDGVHRSSSDETYGALDLSTPQAGAATFVELFEAGDHFVALFAADIEAQSVTVRTMVRAEDPGLSVASWQDFELDLEGTRHEHFPMAAGLFDTFITMALEADDLRIDPRGVEFGDVSELGSFGEAANAVVIDATSYRHPDGLAFVMVESSEGRWRVRQVASPASAMDPTLGIFAAAG